MKKFDYVCVGYYGKIGKKVPGGSPVRAHI